MWRFTRSRAGAGRSRRSPGTRVGIARRSRSTWPGRARTREPAPSCLERYRGYLEARFVDDAHVFASVLFEELVALGFDRSYPTLVREIRELGLRPVCECCQAGAVKLTVGLEHEPGEELQLDWLELTETPWGAKAYVLVGALSHSSRLRGCFAEGESFPHLAEALDGVLRRLGGSARSWRTDRMATFVYPGTDRLRPEAAAMAKHYGVQVAVCPAMRPQRKGVVEKAIQYVTQSWWRSAPVSTPAQAQADLDRWCVAVSDRRRRGRSTVSELAASEPLVALPGLPFGAEYREAAGRLARGAGRVPGKPLQRRARPRRRHRRGARSAR